METYTIRLIGGAEDETATLVIEEQAGDPVHITFHYRDRTLRTSASDYFDAFCAIRLELETEGLLPFCYAASLNVFPTPMARDMGAAISAHRLTPGRHARFEDVVDIFDAGPDVVPASVADQQQFFDTWLHSPRA